MCVREKELKGLCVLHWLSATPDTLRSFAEISLVYGWVHSSVVPWARKKSAKSCPTPARQAPLSMRTLQAKNTGVGCHSLLQGIFLTQGSNPGLLHYRQILYQLSYMGSHRGKEVRIKEQSLGEFFKKMFLCEKMQQEIVRFQVHFVGKLQSTYTLGFKRMSGPPWSCNFSPQCHLC